MVKWHICHLWCVELPPVSPTLQYTPLSADRLPPRPSASHSVAAVAVRPQVPPPLRYPVSGDGPEDIIAFRRGCADGGRRAC